MNFSVSNIPVTQIPVASLSPDPLLEFALSPAPDSLTTSIAELGQTHPMLVCPMGKTHQVISGHRRLQALRALKVEQAFVRVLDTGLSPADKFRLHLLDNRDHRNYSDMEISRALVRMTGAGIDEKQIIDPFMSLLGLEPFKKLLNDFSGAHDFSTRLQNAVHERRLPLRAFKLIYRWNDVDRSAITNLLENVPAGANKWRDLLEMLDELSVRDQRPPCDFLSDPKIISILDEKNIALAERYSALHKYLFSLRHPTLSSLKMDVAKALDKLNMGNGIRLKVPETFESDRFKIEFGFSTREEFINHVERLFQATDSEALSDLLNIFKKFQ